MDGEGSSSVNGSVRGGDTVGLPKSTDSIGLPKALSVVALTEARVLVLPGAGVQGAGADAKSMCDNCVGPGRKVLR